MKEHSKSQVSTPLYFDWAVEVNHLSVNFKDRNGSDFYAVKNISFSVRRGEIFGFLGANGAGKTTTIRVICGLLVPTSGSVRVAGEPLNRGNEIIIKQKVGYMSQKFTLYEDLTIRENLEFSASLRRMPKVQFNRRKKELLDLIQFHHSEDQLVRTLPGGVRQQVSLVSSLLHSPEIVFLDEPTAGVSPSARAQFWSLIKRISSLGTTVFVTTHYMDEAEQCQRIALMRGGELIALNSPSELKSMTFPDGLYELERRESIQLMDENQIHRWRESEKFKLFEPYGLRFHVAFASEQVLLEEKSGLEKYFVVRKIEPTLEDVFIRLVEGNKL